MSNSKGDRPAKDSGSGPVWLSRKQVAALLGVGNAEIEAMHGQALRPSQDADRKWRYSATEIAQVMRAALQPNQRDGGKTTGAAFAMFKENKPPEDVVIALQVPAATVRTLRAEYDEMVGTVTISAEAASALRRALGVGSEAKDGDALVATTVRELEQRYTRGFEDGKVEAEDGGEIVDFTTGERRRVPGR